MQSLLLKKQRIPHSPRRNGARGLNVGRPLGSSLVWIMLITLLSTFPTSAEGLSDLEGVVLSENGGSVSSVVVRILDLRRETITDAEGAFRFDQVPEGSYVIEARGLDTGHAVQRIVVGDQSVPVELQLLDEVHQDEIVVTASPHSRSQLELAQPTTVLDGEQLIANLESTLGETLDNQAGITSSYFGPGASRPIIRGLGGDRVRTLESGIGSLDASTSSPDHAVSVDPGTAQRLEVVRGPATLLYGSSAIGGVVNVLDGRIPEYRASKPLSGQIALQAGSVSDERMGSASLNGGGGNWAWSLGVVNRETDEYEIPGAAEVEGLDEHEEDEHEEEEGEEHEEEGEEHEEEGEHDEDEHEEEGDFGILSNSDIDSSSGRFGASYFFGDRGFLGVSVSGFDTNYGLSGGEHGEHGEHGDEHDEDGEEHEEEGEEHEEEEGEHEEGEEDGVRIDMEQRRIDLRGEILNQGGALRGVRFRAGLVDYEHDEIEGNGEVGTTFFNDAWEGRLEFVQRERGGHSGSFGAQMKIRDLEAIGEEAFIPQAESTNIGIFTFQEIERGRTSYQFGARYENQETDTSDPTLPDRSFDGISGSIGVVGMPDGDWSVGGTLSRAVKMPSGEELYSNGAHFATGLFEIGDANLSEESSLGLDLFVRKNTGRLTGEIHLFRNDFSDYIFQAFAGEEEDELPVTIWSQADAEFVGAELQATLELVDDGTNHLDLEFTGDMVRAEFNDGANLPRIPPMRLGLGLHYHRGPFRASASVREVDDQDRVFDEELPTDGYTMVNATLGYRWLFSTGAFDLMVRGRNLTDEDARNHASFLKDTVPLPGRDIRVDARWSF